MEFTLQVPPFPYDPKKAKQLLAEAGYPNGLDAGLFHAIPGFPTAAEAVVNDLNAAGIRVRYAPMERAAFYADWKAKKFHGLYMTGAGAAGNAASRVEAFIYSKGAYADGGYPDIDELYLQAGEGARPEEARGDAAPDPAIDDRPDDVRAGLRFPRADGGRSARRPGTRSAIST